MIIALDLGIKSIGVAISDETKTIAIPYKNILFKTGNAQEAISIIKDLVEDKNLSIILIGYPVKTDGSRATILDFIDIVINKLEVELPNKKIIKVDERFSTKRGIELIEKKYKGKKKVKEFKDMAAAYVLLNDYLLYN